MTTDDRLTEADRELFWMAVRTGQVTVAEAAVESILSTRLLAARAEAGAEALEQAAAFVEDVTSDGELPMDEGVGAWDAASDCLQELVSRYAGSGPSNGLLVSQWLRARAAEFRRAGQQQKEGQ